MLGRAEHPGDGALAEALLVGGVDLDGGGVPVDEERVKRVEAVVQQGDVFGVVRDWWGKGGDGSGVNLLALHGSADFLGEWVFGVAGFVHGDSWLSDSEKFFGELRFPVAAD